VPGGAATTAEGGATGPTGRTAATSMDAATDRGSAGGDATAAATTATEVLGQGALHELGKWIHDSSPTERRVGRGREGRGEHRNAASRRRAGRGLGTLASPGKERLGIEERFCSPSHRWL
jgi:hypothetical protein